MTRLQHGEAERRYDGQMPIRNATRWSSASTWRAIDETSLHSELLVVSRSSRDTQSSILLHAIVTCCAILNYMEANRQIVVWTHGPDEQQWCKETFEDVGYVDLVRVELKWLVGSGPGHKDMVLDNRVTSEWNADTKTVTDTHDFPGSGIPNEVESGQSPVLLASVLTMSDGVLSGTLNVDRRVHA